ncbi:hypothetical protein AYL99_07135 [Fonsecaea erecta]|uniref:Heterokaryon incompatibility domain-containing protein n=1 Tax=Fonsecaea erecta TaxID=1367422 RepID=A0A178ZG68_9EURO|nr:hypothetical protein AYL99_07135 [Fonsecaea erecta]OAP58045.1 hypothetical protein AYL99_07135 [Fonsecaea erecta]
MERLSTFIHKLPGKLSGISYFWIDTLCIPAYGKNQPELRRVAISKLRDTYANATAILVLDSWLLSSKIASRHDVDILTQIFASHWNRRLWTFQEGALAKSLYVQFADGAYDVDRGVKRLELMQDLTLEYTLKPPVFARYFSLRGFKRSARGCSMAVKLSALFAAFRHRQTSNPSDEAICLATLLELPIEEILLAPKEEKMELMWRLVTRVPRDFVFYTGDTFEQKGLRWAPRTLLRSESNYRGFEEAFAMTDMDWGDRMPWAEPTQNGLKAWLPGLIFVSIKISMAASIYLEDESGIVYRFVPTGSQREISGPRSKPESGGFCSHFYPSYGLVAFILNSEEPNMLEAGLCHQGLLVAIQKSKPEFISARKLCNGYCVRTSSDGGSGELGMLSKIEPSSRNLAGLKNPNKISSAVAARWTKRNTCWVVD